MHLFHLWKQAVLEHIPTDPFPVPLGPLTTIVMNHCGWCNGMKPLEIIEGMVELCRIDSYVNPTHIEGSQLTLKLPRLCCKDLSFPCFCQYVRDHFPYPVELHAEDQPSVSVLTGH